MLVRKDLPASHFGGTVVAGVREEFANGIALTPSVTAVAPSLDAYGDDSNIAIVLKAQAAGVALNKFIGNPVAKAITDSAAYSLFEVPITAASAASGSVVYSIFASDGTDHQCLSGVIHYAGVNKAGTITRSVVEDSTAMASAKSSGTLVSAWTGTDDTNKMTVKVQPTGSLTETTMNVVYTVIPTRGTVTIL